VSESDTARSRESFMLSVFAPSTSSLKRLDVADLEALPADAVWLDLKSPVQGEDKLVEKLVGIEIPTREDMQEIEISSRLYIENGARYMTATLMCATDSNSPRTTPVTFILTDHRLVTVRYDEPKPFMLVAAKLGRSCAPHITGDMVLLELLDGIIDRCADILERVGGEVDNVSNEIFEPSADRGHARKYSQILLTIGRKGDLTSKVRESLVSIGRVISFITVETEAASRWSKEQKAQFKTQQRDVQSLTDHASYLSSKITFVLDAMLGVVNLEQNNIIKLFSVMAVVLMPPTLIASIYGMNFKAMPELEWPHGYPAALLAMLMAAVFPYVFFKWKKWL
jgi:magnesium transporter